MNTVLNPFKDKLVMFIGKPRNFTRVEAKYELANVGGIFTGIPTSNLEYVVTFDGADKTALFEKIKPLSDKGLLRIIDEDEFFDMLSKVS
jgi:BRCT domain type II-containing protein